MITDSDLISIGVIRRTHYKDLPDFVFVRRDGLFVPFRSSAISELIGEEGFILRSEADEEEGLLNWQDLAGYTIVIKDQPLGTIAAVDDSTMNVFVELNDGRLFPMNEDFIVDIDAGNKQLFVEFPFEINE